MYTNETERQTQMKNSCFIWVKQEKLDTNHKTAYLTPLSSFTASVSLFQGERQWKAKEKGATGR